MSNWREFFAPKRPGAWIEKGSCGHTIASSDNAERAVAPTVYTKSYPCEACKRAQGEGRKT